MTRSSSAIAILVTAALLVPAFSFAQTLQRHAADLGAGGAGAAGVRGADAMFLNPANLALEQPGVSGTIGRVSALAGGDLMQFKYYNEIFSTGQYVSDETASLVLDNWFGVERDVRHANVSAETVPLALALHRKRTSFGFGIRSRSFSRVGVGRGWLDLLLIGTEQDRVLPLDADADFFSTLEFTMSVATRIAGGRVAIGVSPRLVLGTELYRSSLTSDVTVANGSLRHDFSYSINAAGNVSSELLDNVHLFGDRVFDDARFSPTFLQPAGRGLGIDMGITYVVDPSLHVALSLTDIGFVSWSSDPQTITPRESVFEFEGIDLDLNRLNNEFDGQLGRYVRSFVDSLAQATYNNVSRDRNRFSTSLPAAMHVGVEWRANRKATISGGTSIALKDAVGNVATAPLVHAGAEYRLGGSFHLPLRAGVQAGGNGAVAVSFGSGLYAGPYGFDFAVLFTPTSDFAGSGGRYAFALSLARLRL